MIQYRRKVVRQMTINERMREIRKSEKLTQTEFAQRLGITMSSISQMERGKINPTNQTIEFACREFNINKRWLEEGIGEMKKPPLDEVAEIVADILDKGEDDPLYRIIIAMAKAYQALGEKDKRFVQGYLDATIKSYSESSGKE